MHIILRYELELGLFNGSISVDQLPSMWRQKMQDSLGVELALTEDKVGVLQDIHWSIGAFALHP